MSSIDERFDLAVCLETLSFVADWRRFLRDISRLTDRLVLSLYLPPTDPIGYVKSFDDLRSGISDAWDVETEVVVVDRGVQRLAALSAR